MTNYMKIHTGEPILTFSFKLTRHSGKRSSLSHGNQIISSNDRMHYIVKSQITRYLRQLSASEAASCKYSVNHPLFGVNRQCCVLVTIHPPTKRRFDAPNLYPTVKALIDGMTDAGVWSDDNNDIIKAMGFACGNISHSKQYVLTISMSDKGE